MSRSAFLIYTLALATMGCEEVRTISLGAGDGVLPVWYHDIFYRLPESYAPEEIPDGRYFIDSTNGGVTLEVDTLAGGRRTVVLHRQAFLLDAATAEFYRDLIGSDAISGINGLDLKLDELRLDGVDMVRCPPEISAGGGVWHGPGSTISVDDVTLKDLRDKLLAGEEIRVPFSITFQLEPDTYSALPSQLPLFLELQPTIYVDALDAI
jgi:hypothetical protein